MGNTEHKHSTLADKVAAWLQAEGYSVEFRTAAEFKAAGFTIFQGYYAGEPGGDLREVDVLARVSLELDGVRFYVEFVVECKWSRDKPWVVFTSHESAMGPSASIAQATASSLGRAVTYCLAGSGELWPLGLFTTSTRGGFGGRQALSHKGDRDTFHAAVQSVVAKAAETVKRYDDGRVPARMPQAGGIAFPLIVLEGSIFEAYHDAAKGTLDLAEINTVKLYWRGAARPGSYIVPVDIVTLAELPRYIAAKKEEVRILFGKVESKVNELSECFKTKRLSPLKIEPGARGYIGLPVLLRELQGLEMANPAAGRKVDPQ